MEASKSAGQYEPHDFSNPRCFLQPHGLGQPPIIFVGNERAVITSKQQALDMAKILNDYALSR